MQKKKSTYFAGAGRVRTKNFQSAQDSKRCIKQRCPCCRQQFRLSLFHSVAKYIPRSIVQSSRSQSGGQQPKVGLYDRHEWGPDYKMDDCCAVRARTGAFED